VTVVVTSRRETNLTQEQLAADIGRHRSKIARIESGERRLDVPEFIAIANALKIEPRDALVPGVEMVELSPSARTVRAIPKRPSPRR
jgi:transcriptional regulator with XRE-family HTH domain